MQVSRGPWPALALLGALAAGGCGEDLPAVVLAVDNPRHVMIIDGLFVSPLQPVAGQTVLLNVLVRDSLGHPADVRWSVEEGSLVTTGFGALWTVPDAPGAYELDVGVADALYYSTDIVGSARVFVPVSAATPVDPTDAAPVIAAFTTDRDSLTSGETATLCVDASDPDGDPLSYYWAFPPGPTAVDGPCATYTAFAGKCLPGDYAFTVRVEDGRGRYAESSLAIYIDPFTE